MNSKPGRVLHSATMVMLVCTGILALHWVKSTEVLAYRAGLQTTANEAQSHLKEERRARTAAVANAAAGQCGPQLLEAEEACLDRVKDVTSKCKVQVRDAEERTAQDASDGDACQRQIDSEVLEAKINVTAACKGELVKQYEDTSVAYARSVLEADVRVLRATLAKFNATLAADWAAELKEQPNRGILFLAGPQMFMLNAFVSLWAIRRHWKSTLPVAIVYWGETESINQATRAFFDAELGEPRVRFIDASKDVPWPAHHRQLFLSNQTRRSPGWALKLAASYLVPFQEIMYFDSDSAPLVSPGSLFDLPEYIKSGALFWPDTPCYRPDVFNDLIEMGLMAEGDAPDASEERQTEAGQWLLDRRRHRVPLEHIMLLATHADFAFARAYGDKDIFRAGFALAGVASDYVLSPQGIGFAWGPPDPARNNSRLMRGYVQFSSVGQPLFHHRAGWEAKYNLDRPEGRPLDAMSGPLPCTFTNHNWPFEYPGERNDSSLRLVNSYNCTYALNESFGEAVKACGGDWDGSVGQRMPVFAVKGSTTAEVHAALEVGWRRILEARTNNSRLFEDY